MDGGFVLEDKPKVEKMAKDSTGTSGRKMLADISNMQLKTSTSTQDKKSLPNSATQKEYIEQLQKEHAALKKLSADKSRIIDLSRAELNKLRVTLHKMQQQNLQLAQSNSQLLAELNSGKDRLKILQHELGCKNGLLIAKELELEGKRKPKICPTNDTKKVKVSEHEEKEVRIDKDEQCNNANRRQKSKSLGPSVRNGQDKVVGDNGSSRGRRQSARFKRDEPEATEDFFDSDNVDLPACPLHEDKMQEDESISVKKDVVNDSSVSDNLSQEGRRSSISRPSRQAAKKVQSYKEMSLHVKMRRD